ncbi:hypothetical protein Vadar_026353 [Vaccinium darrowii]|uniref:Uncharacterized protein n=1 Tax=Vaccinium darrowii TaxID=229202 RepID=A0ACB7YYQ8_9ERIC|nr:hypothetical protein Vadar_026353 [Vaccinium darrowii]
MSVAGTSNPGLSIESVSVKPPSHPTYDLKGVIKLALAEDAGDRGLIPLVLSGSHGFHSNLFRLLKSFAELTMFCIRDVICMATIPADMEMEAHFLAKEDGVVAGIALAESTFSEVDPTLKVEWSRKDGDFVHKGLQFGKVHGWAHFNLIAIVVAERVVLNFMQRMSEIATLTKAMADAACPAYILETRKTVPGLRLVDKWAVLIGGGRNHRMGLFDMVETRTLGEVNEVLHYVSQQKTSLTRIMLDNMVVPQPNGDVDGSMLKEAVDMIDGRFETDASRNVTLETVHKIGQTGMTYISSGALTHSVKALDISLKIDTELALEVGRRTKRA